MAYNIQDAICIVSDNANVCTVCPKNHHSSPGSENCKPCPATDAVSLRETMEEKNIETEEIEKCLGRFESLNSVRSIILN